MGPAISLGDPLMGKFEIGPGLNGFVLDKILLAVMAMVLATKTYSEYLLKYILFCYMKRLTL